MAIFNPGFGKVHFALEISGNQHHRDHVCKSNFVVGVAISTDIKDVTCKRCNKWYEKHIVMPVIEKLSAITVDSTMYDAPIGPELPQRNDVQELSTGKILGLLKTVGVNLDTGHKELVLDYLADCCHTDDIEHAENIIRWMVKKESQTDSIAEIIYEETIADLMDLVVDSDYCQCCTVVPLQEPSQRYCNRCLEEIVEDMAVSYAENIAAERGLY